MVLADLNTAGGEAAAAARQRGGQGCVFQRTDVSAEADVQALVARALSEFGRLDIMFNNAGIGGAVGPLEYISVEDWDRTQASACAASSSASSTRSAPMRAQGGGAIVSTASIAGIDGFPGLHAYCAAKAGVVNLTRSASIEFAADKIRVNCIAPGGVSTPILNVGGAHFDKAATDAMLEQDAAAAAGRPAGGHRPGGALPRQRRVALRHRPLPGGRRRRHRRRRRERAAAGQERRAPATLASPGLRSRTEIVAAPGPAASVQLELAPDVDAHHHLAGLDRRRGAAAAACAAMNTRGCGPVCAETSLRLTSRRMW